VLVFVLVLPLVEDGRAFLVETILEEVGFVDVICCSVTASVRVTLVVEEEEEEEGEEESALSSMVAEPKVPEMAAGH
jgi:hypothetical protein